MIYFRLVFGGLLVASLVCFGLAIATGQPMWRRRGVLILKWALIAGVGFFGVLFAQFLLTEL